MLSDALCGLVTGEGFIKRRVFTAEELTVHEYKRVLGIGGINLVTQRPDLLDRSLILLLDPLTNSSRMREEVLTEKFEKILPELLGGLLDALSGAMKIHADLKIEELPRMADYAKWATAASLALGKTQGDIAKALCRNVARQHDAALDENPVAQVVVEFMNGRKSWSGTPTQLYRVLDVIAEALVLKKFNWPKNPGWMVRNLHSAHHSLAALGISWRESRPGGVRTISLTNAASDVNDGTSDGGAK